MLFEFFCCVFVGIFGIHAPFHNNANVVNTESVRKKNNFILYFLISYFGLKKVKMSLKIFADLMSQPSRAVVMFCRAAKVPHELKELRIKNGDFKTPEMAKINPFEKVNRQDLILSQ